MLSQAEKQYIAEQLLGSCSDGQHLVEKFNLGAFDGDLIVAQAANEFGVWLCHSCGWWVDEDTLANTYGDIICEECDSG